MKQIISGSGAGGGNLGASGPAVINNFDLIRLFAALQVVYEHVLSHLDVKIPWAEALGQLANLFPGVPIFFVLSGFLVYWAFSKCPEWRRFARNRFLRLYPGLWVSFACTCFLLVGFRVVTPKMFLTRQLLVWVLTQITVFPVYTPDVLRPWGAHNPNGSLWTIVVELQYYMAVPLLHRMLGGRNWAVVWAGLFALSYSGSLALGHLTGVSGTAGKLAAVLLLPYLFYFLMGIGLYKAWPQISPYLVGRGLWWAAAYVGYTVTFSAVLRLYDISYMPSPLGLVGYMIMAAAVLSTAYSAPAFAKSVLHGTDLSYGIYIYHMLVINSLMALNLTGTSRWMAFAIGCTLAMSAISWQFVEHPALRLKSKWR